MRLFSLSLLSLLSLSLSLAQQQQQQQQQAATTATTATTTAAPQAANVIVAEKVLDGEVEDLAWLGGETILLLTDRRSLYRSADEGKTWTNQMGVLSSAMGSGAEDAKVTVTSVHVSAADEARAFVVGSGESHWVTTDFGATYRVVRTPSRVHEVKLHPSEEDLVLASTMSPKCLRTEAAGQCFKSLLLSSDFGATWRTLTTYVVQFEWAHNLKRGQAEGLPLESVFATVFGNKVGNQRFGYWDADIHFVRSDDAFRTAPRELVRHGNRFLFTSKFLFVARVNPADETKVALHISDNGGRTFTQASLPFAIDERSYTILDTSEDTVFLHVNHKGDGAQWGNVYVSNSLGLNYSLSLPYNRRDANGKCDFEKMEGVEGIYLANYIDNVAAGDLVEESAPTISAESSSEKKVANKGGASKKGANGGGKSGGKSGGGGGSGKTGGGSGGKGSVQAAKRKGKAKPHVRTVITFDKGAVWGYLRPPTVDSRGKSIDCSDPSCSLHLHGLTDVWGPFYSTASAIGLMLATGNVGPYLTDREDEINTYFSRDAGLHWYEVRKGSHIYEIGDHGAIIVMANDRVATKHLVYSWNEGVTWEELVFSNTPVEVENIIIEPGATSQKFLLYGAREDEKGVRLGVVVYVDFEALHMRPCTGVDIADAEQSDYEKWSPSDGRAGEFCLMGHEISYTRRKRERSCFNGEEYERRTWMRNCTCREEDYECDEGYARKVEGGPCVRVGPPVNLTALIPAACPWRSTYEVSNGYRRVAGDTCIGGVDHSPLVLPCPHWTDTVRRSSWTGFIITAAVVGLLGYCCFAARRGGDKSPHRGMSPFELPSAFTYTAAPTSWFARLRELVASARGVGASSSSSSSSSRRAAVISSAEYEKVPNPRADQNEEGDDFGLGDDQDQDEPEVLASASTAGLSPPTTISISGGAASAQSSAPLGSLLAPSGVPASGAAAATAAAAVPVPRLQKPRSAALPFDSDFNPRAGEGDAI